MQGFRPAGICLRPEAASAFFTKRLIAVWALLALAAVAWEAGGWHALFRVSLAAGVAAALLAVVDRRTVALTLALAYVTPALLLVTTGRFHIYFAAPWLAAWLGVLAADAWRSPWRLPPVWRIPLLLWALTVAAGSTIVVLREFDFNPRLFFGGTLAPQVLGTHPVFAAMWTLHGGALTIAGILWFDWLHALTPADFRRFVVMPLVGSLGVLCAVTIYQMFGDIGFLNANVYGLTGRASGTTFDANVTGTIAAMWIGAALVVPGRRRWPAGLIVAAGWCTVWGTGSKTALALALIATGGVGASALRRDGGATRSGRHLLVAAVLVGLAFFILKPVNVSPWSRLGQILPHEWTLVSVRDFARSLWDRNHYGAASMVMIRAFPATGVGPGGFVGLAGDYNTFWKGGDNAQNWYRQQLAELGLVGSIGWMAWVGVLSLALARGLRARRSLWGIGASLVGFAVISLFGVPAQDPAVTLTFWTFAYWGSSAYPAVAATDSAPLRRAPAVAIVAVVLVFAALTLYAATHALRPPMRAARALTADDPQYSYGIYDPEPDPAGIASWHWVEQRASWLASGEHAWLELRLRSNHAGVEGTPIEVRASCDNVEVMSATLSSAVPAVVYVSRPAGSRHPIVVDTWVSRVVIPADVGVADPRMLGAQVSWRFVGGPPPNARIVRLR